MRRKGAIGLVGMVVVFQLSGCATPEEEMEKLRQRCVEYGYSPNTDLFAVCVQSEAQADNNRDFVRSQRASQIGYDMMMGQGAYAPRVVN